MARGDGGRNVHYNRDVFLCYVRALALPVLLGIAAVAAVVVLLCKVPQVGEFFVSLWKGIAAFFSSLWQGICGLVASEGEKASAAEGKPMFGFLKEAFEDMNTAQALCLCGFSAFGLFNLYRMLFLRSRRLKGLFMLVTAVLYGGVLFVTLGGTVFLNGTWFYIIASLCVALMLITAMVFGRKSFSESIGHILAQLFISALAWVVFKWLDSITKEGEAVIPWLSVLQFTVFAVAFVFQLVAFYLNDIIIASSNGGSYRDPSEYDVVDMEGSEADWDGEGM